VIRHFGDTDMFITLIVYVHSHRIHNMIEIILFKRYMCEIPPKAEAPDVKFCQELSIPHLGPCPLIYDYLSNQVK